MKNGDGMFKRIIIISLIITFSFNIFADETADTMQVQRPESQEIGSIDPKIKEEEPENHSGRSFLMNVFGFSSILAVHAISYQKFYENKDELSKFSTYYFVPLLVPFAIGIGIVSINHYIEVYKKKMAASEAYKKGESLAAEYYIGVLIGMAVELGIIVVAAIMMFLAGFSFSQSV